MNSLNMRKFYYCAASAMVVVIVHGVSLAQTVGNDTVVLPNPIYPVVDENGVNLSSNTLNVPGPSVSIGDPRSGGLEISPNIVGPDAIQLAPCLSGSGASCADTGYTTASTNMSASLVMGGGRWGMMPLNAGRLTVNTGSGVARFYNYSLTGTQTEYSPQIGRTLSYSSGNPSATQFDTGERMTFQDSDGTLYIFFYISNPNLVNASTFSFPIQSIVRPEGTTTTFVYKTQLNTTAAGTTTAFTLNAIYNNRGYMVKFQNGSATMGAVNASNGVVGINLATEPCSATASTCNLSNVWPMLSGGRFFDSSGNATYSPWPHQYVDAGGATTIVNMTPPSSPYGNPALLSATLTRPNGRVLSYTYDYTKNVPSPVSPIVNCPQHPSQIPTSNPNWAPLWTFPCPYATIKAFNNGALTWNYALSFNFLPVPGAPSGNYYVSSVVSTRTDPAGGVRTITALPSGQVTSVTDELNRTTMIDVQPVFDPNEGRINKITYPRGNSKTYTYDVRGNVTSVVVAPATGSTQASLTTTYVYPSSCTNWKICNKPTSMTDPRGKVTTYIWDANSGQLLTETLPADANGISPVRRLSYTQLYAWIANGSGGYVQAGPPIWMLTQMRTCIATATVGNACSGGTTDEVVTDYYYGPQSGPNNLQLRGMSVTSNGVRLNTCYGYNRFGRRISETKPNANVAVCP